MVEKQFLMERLNTDHGVHGVAGGEHVQSTRDQHPLGRAFETEAAATETAARAACASATDLDRRHVVISDPQLLGANPFRHKESLSKMSSPRSPGFRPNPVPPNTRQLRTIATALRY